MSISQQIPNCRAIQLVSQPGDQLVSQSVDVLATSGTGLTLSANK